MLKNHTTSHINTQNYHTLPHKSHKSHINAQNYHTLPYKSHKSHINAQNYHINHTLMHKIIIRYHINHTLMHKIITRYHINYIYLQDICTLLRCIFATLNSSDHIMRIKCIHLYKKLEHTSKMILIMFQQYI